MQVIVEDGSAQVKSKTRTMTKVRVKASRIMLGNITDNDTGRPSVKSWRTSGQDYTVERVTTSPLPTATDEYQFSPENRVLVHDTLRELGLENTDVDIHVTLPVDRFYNRDGTKNTNNIERKKVSLMQPITNGSGMQPARIQSVSVWPEAVPAWFDYYYDNAGQVIANRAADRVVIIDIGGTTSDVSELYTDESPIRVVRRESIDRGVFDIMHALRDLTGKRTFDPSRLERTLRNDVDTTRNASREVYHYVLSRLREFIKDADDYDVILFVGGGSAILGHELAADLGKGLVPTDPDESIARGLDKILARAGM